MGGEMSNLRDNARDLRKHMTDAERRLWSSLRHTQLGARFRRQAPIGPYIADFACFDPRLVIEIDGGQHAEQRGYDSRRDDWLKSQGFTVLRFWNNDVMGNFEGVRERILSKLRMLSGSTPHPNPPPQGGRESRDVASCDGDSELPNPPPQGGREQEGRS